MSVNRRMVDAVIHDLRGIVKLLVDVVLRLAELADGLAQAFGELWQLLRTKHDENNHENDDHVGTG
jgi:hypothetical protein